jgi:hypothetical protein
MAGFGHKNLAALGSSLRPYFGYPGGKRTSEGGTSKSSSKYQKPEWQRELIQSAALMATKAKQDRATVSIEKSALEQKKLDRIKAQNEQIEKVKTVNPDYIKGGLDSSFADAQGRARFPTMGRGGHLGDMPDAYKQAQAATWLHEGTDTKRGDILAKVFGGDVELDYESGKRKLAGEVMQEKRDIATTEKAELALEEKKNVISRSLKTWERKEAKVITDAKAKLVKEALEKKEEFEKAQEADAEADRKRNIKITALNRKTSLENLKLANERGKERKKVEDKITAAKVKLAKDEAKAQEEIDKKLNIEIAKIHALNPRERLDLTIPTQKMMAAQIFGEGGMSGSFRTGFNTRDRIDPSSPTTRGASLQWPESAKTLGGFLGAQLGDFGIGAPDVAIPESERDILPTPTDEDWTRMLTPQERMVIMDQLWRRAVSIANSKGTSAQHEFNLLSLAISRGEISPYEYMPGSAKTDTAAAVSPDIQELGPDALLAKLQSGDSLGNHVYNIPDVGAFRWDNQTQKFIKVQ